MSPTEDITKKPAATSVSVVCEPQTDPAHPREIPFAEWDGEEEPAPHN